MYFRSFIITLLTVVNVSQAAPTESDTATQFANRTRNATLQSNYPMQFPGGTVFDQRYPFNPAFNVLPNGFPNNNNNNWNIPSQPAAPYPGMRPFPPQFPAAPYGRFPGQSAMGMGNLQRPNAPYNPMIPQTFVAGWSGMSGNAYPASQGAFNANGRPWMGSGAPAMTGNGMVPRAPVGVTATTEMTPVAVSTAAPNSFDNSANATAINSTGFSGGIFVDGTEAAVNAAAIVNSKDAP